MFTWLPLGFILGLITGNATLRAWVVAKLSQAKEAIRNRMGSK